jgi:hypothetical protein
MLLADRGYDADWIRKLAMKKGPWANIPPKSNRSDPICFSPYLYRARNQRFAGPRKSSSSRLPIKPGTNLHQVGAAFDHGDRAVACKRRVRMSLDPLRHRNGADYRPAPTAH